jgi:hypothetical protein
MAHEAFDAAAARRVPQAAQGRMDSGRAIAAAMGLGCVKTFLAVAEPGETRLNTAEKGSI